MFIPYLYKKRVDNLTNPCILINIKETNISEDSHMARLLSVLILSGALCWIGMQAVSSTKANVQAYNEKLEKAINGN